MHRHIMLFFLATFLTSAGAVAQKIGFVNLERAVGEEDEAVEARIRLKKQFEDKQKLLDQKQKVIQALQEKYEKQKPMMTESAKEEKRLEIQKKLAELQSIYVNLQKEMAQKEQEAMSGILQKNGTIIEQLGKTNGFDYILNSATVLFSKQTSNDLTNEVVRRYNDSYKVGTKVKNAKRGPKKG